MIASEYIYICLIIYLKYGVNVIDFFFYIFGERVILTFQNTSCVKTLNSKRFNILERVVSFFFFFFFVCLE